MERRMNVARGSYLFPRQERSFNTEASTSRDSPCSSSPVDKKFDLRRMSREENCTFSGNGRGPQGALSYTSPSVKLLLFLLLLLPNAFFVDFRASAQQIREGEAASRSNDGVVEVLRPPAPSSSGQHAVDLNKGPRRGPVSTSTSSSVLLDASSRHGGNKSPRGPAATPSSLLEEEEKKLLVDTAKHKQSEQQRTGEAEAKIDLAKLNQHEAAARRMNFNERQQMATASTKAGTAQQEEKSTRKKLQQQQQRQQLQNKGKHQAEEQKTSAQERRMNREQRSRAKEQLAEVARAKQMAKQGARWDLPDVNWGEVGGQVYDKIGDAWHGTAEGAWNIANQQWDLDDKIPHFEEASNWWNNDVWTIDNAHDLSTANTFGSGRMQVLSCLSGTSVTEESVMRVQKEIFLVVLQKRSFSCEKRSTKPRKYFSCLAVHCRAFTIHSPALQVSRPRHICNAYDWWQDHEDHGFGNMVHDWNDQELHDKVGQVATVAGATALGAGAIGLAAQGSGKKDTAKAGAKGKGSKAAGMPKDDEQSEEQDGDNAPTGRIVPVGELSRRAEAAPPPEGAAAPAEPSAVEQREPPAGEAAAPATPPDQDQPDKQQPGGAGEAADDEEPPPEEDGGSGGEEDAEPVSRKSSRKKKKKNAPEGMGFSNL